MQLSPQRLKVLARFMEERGTELSGADIMRLTGLASGSLYPILSVFENAGLLESRWEAQVPQELGRPRKRLYRLTAVGERTAREAGADLAALIHSLRTPSGS